ncbi:MAG TPA: class I SAM-dependent methyltransferase [Acidobacteriaceae bacterium]|nr:class I SAM-dependent methyltransferase [Acidobacteriaceae bacterium]
MTSDLGIAQPSVSNHPPNFDRLARAYRWMEYFSFGTMLERCRFRYLQDCGDRRRALILGDGDGRFTARLLTENADLYVEAVDCSPAMLAQLQRRVKRRSTQISAELPPSETRLRTICADIRDFSPQGNGYDLIVSHFFLDCLTHSDVEALMKRLLPKLGSDSKWIVSEFAIPRQGWQRRAAQLLVSGLYFAFRQMTHLQVKQLPDYAAVFFGYGFRCTGKSRTLWGLLSAEVWERDVL